MKSMKTFAVAATVLLAANSAMALRVPQTDGRSRPATTVIESVLDRDAHRDAKEADKRARKEAKELRKQEHEREKAARKAERRRAKDARHELRPNAGKRSF
jgi:hypothetical protein